jgi:hypothetical protein
MLLMLLSKVNEGFQILLGNINQRWYKIISREI